MLFESLVHLMGVCVLRSWPLPSRELCDHVYDCNFRNVVYGDCTMRMDLNTRENQNEQICAAQGASQEKSLSLNMIDIVGLLA